MQRILQSMLLHSMCLLVQAIFLLWVFMMMQSLLYFFSDPVSSTTGDSDRLFGNTAQIRAMHQLFTDQQLTGMLFLGIVPNNSLGKFQNNQTDLHMPKAYTCELH